MRILNPKELKPGMITAASVKTPLGQVLCGEGTEITLQLINRMKLYKVEEVVVEGKATVDETEETPESAPVTKTHAEKSKTHSQKIAASDEFRDFQLQYFEAMNKLHTFAVSINAI